MRPKDALLQVRHSSPLLERGLPHVALIHSFYRSESPSGENLTVLNHFEWLPRLGFPTTLISVNSDDRLSGGIRVVRAGTEVASFRGVDPTAQLREVDPQIVHVHNVFPNFSSRAIADWHGPIVVSMHNYRPVCSAATLSRDGHWCEDCHVYGSRQALHHKCYRGSFLATLPMALRTRRGISGDPLLQRADAVLVPSELMQTTYAKFGLQTRLMLQPVLENPLRVEGSEPTGGWLFIGRLTDEKGIRALLEAWPREAPLDVVGTGPLADFVAGHPLTTKGVVRYFGWIDEGEKARLLARSRGLVFPSLWLEGAPAVFAEMLAAGRPVLALAGNSVADAVRLWSVGVVVEALEVGTLRSAIADVERNRVILEERAHETFRAKYSIDQWGETLKHMYGRLSQV